MHPRFISSQDPTEIIDLTQDEKEVKQAPSSIRASPVAEWFFTLWDPVHPVEGEVLYAHLSTLCKSFGFQLEAGKEDGRLHYQGEISLIKKVRKIDPLFTDWKDRIYFERTRNPGGARNYCGKIDTRVEGPWTFGQIKGKKRSAYADALEAKDLPTAVSIVKENFPRDFVLYGDRISSNLANCFKKPRAVFEPYEAKSFVNVPLEMSYWAIDNIGKNKRRFPMLVVEGTTQLGKTEWARSLGPHVYWKGQTNASDLVDNVDATYLVIDDIDWEFVPPSMKKSVCLGSGECTLTDKYRAKMNVFWNVPCIFLCNDLGRWPFVQEQYWQANCTHVKITSKLY